MSVHQSTFLHLSDLHIDENINIDIIINSLGKDITEQYEKDNKKYHLESIEALSFPDFAIITGDLLSTGSQNQYKKALEFLNKLKDRLFEGKSENIIICSGNHDLSWQISNQNYRKVTRPLKDEYAKAVISKFLQQTCKKAKKQYTFFV